MVVGRMESKEEWRSIVKKSKAHPELYRRRRAKKIFTGLYSDDIISRYDLNIRPISEYTSYYRRSWNNVF